MAFSIALNLRSHNGYLFFFFLNDPATTEISPLPLPAPLPISRATFPKSSPESAPSATSEPPVKSRAVGSNVRSEEHTSELQSQSNLVCRLLLEKKKNPLL